MTKCEVQGCPCPGFDYEFGEHPGVCMHCRHSDSDHRRKETMSEAKSGSAVDHPAHYGGEDNPYEAIKVIEALRLNFCLGNTMKYIFRAGKKSEDPIEDLEKAQWYLARELKRLKAEKLASEGRAPSTNEDGTR